MPKKLVPSRALLRMPLCAEAIVAWTASGKEVWVELMASIGLAMLSRGPEAQRCVGARWQVVQSVSLSMVKATPCRTGVGCVSRRCRAGPMVGRKEVQAAATAKKRLRGCRF